MTTYTREQQMEFKERFRSRRKRQIILAVPFIGVVLAVFLTRHSKGQDVYGIPLEVWGPVFLLLVLGALVFSFLNWRCPACDRYLGRDISPRFCTQCGVELR